ASRQSSFDRPPSPSVCRSSAGVTAESLDSLHDQGTRALVSFLDMLTEVMLRVPDGESVVTT
ncbi:MAG TPA: hypothetical protein VGW38_24495, partial [Chloroflexota bacterium]|nr:hypothetical protein [Chloroflexota bacterium]